MPSLGCFMVAYKWMYGGTTENARMMYDEYIRQGEKRTMFAMIREYKETVWKAYARN